jgi:Amt family ammonium transporter
MDSSDVLWVLISAALVFFMQAGFKVLETGLVPEKHRSGIGVKNLLDWIAGILAFFFLGFGLMFGESIGGLFGGNLFFGEGLDDPNGHSLGIFFFLFQLSFAGTALTIISGAMSGRTGIIPYFLASMCTAVVIYPIFGHWVWGNAFYESNTAWLANLGFIDFAGSTVVHSVGAWVGLAGIYVVGPRIGRYDVNGKLLPKKASDYSYSILGVMILWLGWWGFNGGSTLTLDKSVGQIILNTNLAGAIGGLTAYLHAIFTGQKTEAIEKLAGGTLGGLVAITAGCHILTPMGSVLIGLLAGLVHNYSYDLIIKKLKLDDPVGAIPVHGFCGAFGTLALAFFAPQDLLALPRLEQITIQLIGIIICLVFSASISFALFSILKKSIGLRVSPDHELKGHFLAEEETMLQSAQQVVSEVAIQVSDKGFNLLTSDEFLRIPIEKRLELSKENRIQYLDENGIRMADVLAVQQLTNQEPTGKELPSEKYTNYIPPNQVDTTEADLGIKESFDGSFVLAKPLNNEPRCLYWFAEKDEYILLATAELHSTQFPSSMVNMLGVTFLNQLAKNELQESEDALSLYKAYGLKFEEGLELKEPFYQCLELGLVVINRKKKELKYAGRELPVYFMGSKGAYGLNMLNSIPHHEHFGTLYQLKSGKNELVDLADLPPLVSDVVNYNPGDRLYLSTEGYPAQLGIKDQPFSRSRLRDALLDIQDQSMKNQRIKLEDSLTWWQSGRPQTEDILVVGITLT